MKDKEIIEQVMKLYEDGEIDYVDKALEVALAKQREDILKSVKETIYVDKSARQDVREFFKEEIEKARLYAFEEVIELLIIRKETMVTDDDGWEKGDDRNIARTEIDCLIPKIRELKQKVK